MATHFKEYNKKLVESERSTQELAKRTDDFLEELFETKKMVQTIDAKADLGHRIAMRNERLITNCAGELQGLREGSQQNWSEQRIRQDQLENRVSALELKTLVQTEESFSEGDNFTSTALSFHSLMIMRQTHLSLRRVQIAPETPIPSYLTSTNIILPESMFFILADSTSFYILTFLHPKTGLKHTFIEIFILLPAFLIRSTYPMHALADSCSLLMNLITNTLYSTSNIPPGVYEITSHFHRAYTNPITTSSQQRHSIVITAFFRLPVRYCSQVTTSPTRKPHSSYHYPVSKTWTALTYTIYAILQRYHN